MQLLLAFTVALSLILPAQQINQPQAAYPTALASLGDSITTANRRGTDHKADSWSAGSNQQVQSHALRIGDADPVNLAVSGSKMADLDNQVGQLPLNTDYVTILLGDNDACTGSVATMTPVATYRAQLDAGLDALTARLPDARILLVSTLNVYQLWELFHNDSNAQLVWDVASICQSMFVNPTSTAPADVQRRQDVRQRLIDYNTQLAQACGLRIHCRYDGGAVFNAQLTATDIATGLQTGDYFHPSLTGQARLAEATYAASFDFSDTQPPTTTAVVQRSGDMATISFSAIDNVGVSGIEYKLNGGAWTRYTAPLSLPATSTVVVRAVDVNGLNEAARQVTIPEEEVPRETVQVFVPLVR